MKGQRNQHQILFSDALDRLLNKGRKKCTQEPENITAPPSPVQNDIILSKDLISGWQRLRTAVNLAGQFLITGSEALLITPDPNICFENLTPNRLKLFLSSKWPDNIFPGISFSILDQNAYLLLALCLYSESKKQALASLIREVRAVHNEIDELIDEHGWKLIPMNRERKKNLDPILPEYHYLFPWYQHWVEMPPASLDILVEAMAGQPVDENIVSRQQLAMLQQDVEQDPRSFAILTDQAMLAREIEKAYTIPQMRKNRVNIPEPIKQLRGHFHIDQLKKIFQGLCPSTLYRPAGALAMACLAVMLITLVNPSGKNQLPLIDNIEVYGYHRAMTRSGEPRLVPFKLSQNDSLESGDYYRVRLTAETDGYVYLISLENQRKAELLAEATMQAGEEIVLPKGNNICMVDEHLGRETLLILASRLELTDLASRLQSLRPPLEKALRQVYPDTTIREFSFRHR